MKMFVIACAALLTGKDATARAIADVNAPTVLRHRQIVVRNTIE
jgi:hypothetical protein